MSIFNGNPDPYGGIIVRASEEPCDRTTMEQLLKESLKVWTANSVKGVWFEVEPNYAEWIPVLIQHGFAFHNANPKLSVLLKWLPIDEPCAAPLFSHTMIGIGAMVMNEKEEILLVEDKCYHTPHWKFPGGYVDPGETLPEAVKREVFEETGVKTEFISLVCFRHFASKGGKYGCSDIYFVAHLKPIGGITDIKICPREIEKACWMPLRELVQHPLAFPEAKFFAKQLIAILSADDKRVPIERVEGSVRGREIYLSGQKKGKL